MSTRDPNALDAPKYLLGFALLAAGAVLAVAEPLVGFVQRRLIVRRRFYRP